MTLALNRREWAACMLAGTVLEAAPKPIAIAVVGAGVFGAWTAYYLQAAGHKVTLIDQYGPASSRASSGGESRIIRAAYGSDRVYTHMAKRSLDLWSEFFAHTGRNLLNRTGVLWMASADSTHVNQSRDVLRQEQVPFDTLSSADLARQYPQIKLPPDATAIYEPNSGALMARQAVQAVVDDFIQKGGVYRHAFVQTPREHGTLSAVSTSDGQSIAAETYIFACGPWLAKVFPELLGQRIFPTRQEVLFFGVPPGDRRFEPPQMPIWLDFTDSRGMYGFPDLENRGFKVAFDLHGPAFDPDLGHRMVSPEKLAEGRAYVAERFPALANAPVSESRVCQYENTANGDFLIDRHPDLDNVWLVGGGSGHGFKHGPAVGEYTAARVTGAKLPATEPRFSLVTKSTHQSRTVF